MSFGCLATIEIVKIQNMHFDVHVCGLKDVNSKFYPSFSSPNAYV
jgi:hypothetical protein